MNAPGDYIQNVQNKPYRLLTILMLLTWKLSIIYYISFFHLYKMLISECWCLGWMFNCTHKLYKFQLEAEGTVRCLTIRAHECNIYNNLTNSVVFFEYFAMIHQVIYLNCFVPRRDAKIQFTQITNLFLYEIADLKWQNKVFLYSLLNEFLYILNVRSAIWKNIFKKMWTSTK
jgi:hypothetical protein